MYSTVVAIIVIISYNMLYKVSLKDFCIYLVLNACVKCNKII